VSLALSTLLYEWRRYLAAVIALAVAGLLVLSLTGMFMGMSKSFTATVDRSPAEVMVLPPNSDNVFDSGGGQPRRLIPEIYQHSAVLEARPLNIGFTGWSNFPTDGQPAKDQGVEIFIVDPVRGAVTLPSDFSDQVINALKEPFAVVVDRSSLGKLGVQVGDKAKMNGFTVWVRDTVQGYPSMFNAVVFVSPQTAKLIRQFNDGPQIGAIVVKIAHNARASEVAAQLNVMAKGRYRAWSREELSDAGQRSMLKEGGIVVILGFAVVVGIFIGVVITWQTLQGAILANIKEFASLRALGVSMRSLRLIVMELSLWVGLAGLALTAILAGVVWVLSTTFGVPMDFPLFIDIPVAIAMVIVAVLSGVLSLRILKKSQPAELLR
jgi:putative ABC transport system permease protein